MARRCSSIVALFACVTAVVAQPTTLCDPSLSCAGGQRCYQTPQNAADPFSCVSTTTNWFSCPGLNAVWCANNATFCPPPGSTSALCSCSASSGYTGAYCEYSTAICSSGALACANGGTCAGTYCRCDTTKWIGVQCTLPVLVHAAASSAASPPGTVNVPKWGVALIVAGVVLLALCGGCICFMAYRERKGTPVFHKLTDDTTGMTRGQSVMHTAAGRDLEAT